MSIREFLESEHRRAGRLRDAGGRARKIEGLLTLLEGLEAGGIWKEMHDELAVKLGENASALGDLADAVKRYTGQDFHPTADRHGADAAVNALETAAPCVAPPAVDDRAQLRRELADAVRPLGVTWTPRHPTGHRFEAIASQALPRDGDTVKVDGHDYIAGPAEHDGMSCSIVLRFIHGRSYPAVQPIEGICEVQAEKADVR